MGDSIGKVYIDVQVRKDKIASDMNDIKSDIINKGKDIENNFKSVKLDIDNSAAKTKIKDLENESTKSTDKIADGFKKIGQQILAAAAAMFAFQKVKQFFSDALGSFEGREKAMLGVESVIKSMGKESEFTARGLLAMAEQLERVNKYSVETTDILDLQGFLLTLDTMTKDLLPKATQVVIDLAARMKTDLVSAAKSVGIALEDPEGGLNRFRRSGIVFSDAQKEMIKSMVEAGDKAGAQAKIFEVLESKVGGYARNTTSAFEETKNRLEESFRVMERAIGGFIAKAINPILQSFQSLMPKDTIQEFKKLSASVKNTETNIISLIKVYSELSNKANLNKQEHEKLHGAIEAISAAFPGAITQWDEYGNAIAISTVKLWELIAAEKERLKYTNREAIQKNYNEYGETKTKMESLEFRMKRGTRTDAESGAIIPYTPEEISQLNDELKKLGELKRGIEAQHQYLTGGNINTEAPKISKGGSGTGGDAEKEKVSMAIDELKFMSADYYGYKIDLINKEAEARIKDGQDAVIVEMAKYNKLRELAKEYLDFVDKEFKPYGFTGDANFKLETTDQLVNKVPDKTPGKDPGNKSAIKETTAQLKVQLALSEALSNGFESAGNALANTMGQAVQVFGQANSLLQQFINNLAEAVVKELALKAAMGVIDWLTGGLSGFVSKLFGGGSGSGGSGNGASAVMPAMPAMPAHSGGDFIGTHNGVMKMASGGSFMVPPGFGHDSYPLMVESGERVSVTPANQVNNYGGLSNGDIDRIVSAIQVMNRSLINKNMSVAVNVNSNIDAVKFTKEVTLPQIDNLTRRGYKNDNVSSLK